MKINYKNTCLSFLDDPDNINFEMADSDTKLNMSEQYNFMKSFKTAFKQVVPFFKKNIQYVSIPFFEAYDKSRQKLKSVFDKEQIDDCGTLIWQIGSHTMTCFYSIKTTGTGDAWKADWVYCLFSKYSKDDHPILNVLVSQFGNHTKQFIWNGYEKTGLKLDIYYFLGFLTTFICFLKYVDLETKVVQPGQRAHHNGQKYVNESAHKIEILDSTWFTTLVRSEGFKVGGHLRLQACGPGLSQRRLTWIPDFEKKGYTRRAKILQNNHG